MRTTADTRRSLLRFAALALGPEWEVRAWGVEGEFRFPFARVAPITPATPTGPASYSDVAQTYAIHCYPTPGPTADDSIVEVERVKELLHVAFEIGVPYQDPLIPPWMVVAQRINTGGVLAAGVYSYELTAVMGGGSESLPSDAVVVTLTGSTSRVWLGCMPVPGAVSYNVYRGGLLIGSTPDGDFYDTGYAAGTQVPPVTCTAVVDVESSKRRVPLYNYDGVPIDGIGAFSNQRHPHDYLKVLDFSLDEGVDPEDDTEFRVVAQLRVTWRRTAVVPGASDSATQKTLQEIRLVEVGS